MEVENVGAAVLGGLFLLAAILAVVISARSGRKTDETLNAISEATLHASQIVLDAIDTFGRAVVVAETLVRSAEQLKGTGPERFDYVISMLRTMFPDLPYELIEAALEAGVQKLNTATKPIVLALPDVPKSTD